MRSIFSKGVSFEPDRDIPDLSGKVIIVTGGNNGLGKESVLQLARHSPAKLYLGARSEAKAQDAIKEIKEAAPNANIIFLEIDLSSFASIKRAAANFLAENDRLDILMNNAGLFLSDPGLTREGYEIQFGTNYLGPALFTQLLIPILESTASKPFADVRVITISSELYKWAPKGGILFPQLKTTCANVSGLALYGQSKLGNYLFTKSLAARYPTIKFVTLHPGLVKTGIGSAAAKSWTISAFNFLSNIIAVDVQTGAMCQLWASTAPSDQVESGVFYYPVGRKHDGQGAANNEALERKLWDWTQGEFKSLGFN